MSLIPPITRRGIPAWRTATTYSASLNLNGQQIAVCRYCPSTARRKRHPSLS